MNLDQLKRDEGYRVKLVPPAHHLDVAGESLPFQDEDWIIMAVTNDYIEISAPSGHFYRLGKDHIRSFMTDPHRSIGGSKHALLQLHVQLFIQASDVRAVPNHLPGAPVAPPPVNLAVRARATFAPELERIFRRQVQILGRIVPNYSMTSNGKGSCPGDTWESLRPYQPQLYPTAAVFRDLSTMDAALLAEFYGAVSEVADILAHWIGTVSLTENNAWNVLMHKVQHSLRMGEMAVQKFCPDRQYDATIPAGGTLLFQSQRILSVAESTRSAFIAKRTAIESRPPPLPPRPRRR